MNGESELPNGYSDDETPRQGQVDKKKKKRPRKKVTKPNEVVPPQQQSAPVVMKKRERVLGGTSKMDTNIEPGSSSSDRNEGISERDASASQSNSRRSGSPLRELNLDLMQRLWLDVNHLAPLKRRSAKHPNAIFVCKLCQYYCMSIEHCDDHIKEQKHCHNYSEEGKHATLVNLPYPTLHHTEAVSEILYEVHNMYGISSAQKVDRKRYADEINKLISDNLPGCSIQLYGSSMTGFGVKSSNINLDFVVSKDLHAPAMLKGAYNALSKSSIAICVLSDFHAEIPSVTFMDTERKYNCILSLNSHAAHKTSELLAKYDNMDPRVKILGSSLRYWAQLCKIDDPTTGMLPSYSYNLMLVYFLQQIEPPVLPVIKDDDPDIVPDWTSDNKMSPGELWIRLFRFYTLEHPNTENVVCIRSKEPVKRSEKNWTGKKIAIEDPFHRKRNVSRYIVNHASHDYIFDCLNNTYRYFGIPQLNNGPVFALIRKPLEEYQSIPDVKRNMVAAEKSLNDQMDCDNRFMQAECSDTQMVNKLGMSKMMSVTELEERLRGNSLKTELPQQSSPQKQYCQLVVSPKLANSLCTRVKRESLEFKMDVKPFTFGKQPPIVCNICQMEGHTKNRCPDNYLPPLQTLPPMKEDFMFLLDTVCQHIMKQWSPTPEEINERQSIVTDLQSYLKTRYPTVKLELFGSSCNGFGFHKSDLDICLTFNDSQTGENINYVSLIEELVHELKAYGKLTNLIPITTAKVPIVKFTYPKSKLDGDISLYNTLAQRNTLMLKLYSKIDPRVRILGFVFKRFAKLCDICDASRGSLSSYAYVLMVIYFLQQCNPPVIPVLQQLYPPGKHTEVIVEGWNTWFYDDFQNLRKVWPSYGANKCSAGTLWLQLLRFYTETFDFNEHVVCIRQKEKLLRFEKLWNSKCMAIEDPFDLTHNLGSGLSRKMNNFIIKAFRKGRMHFGSPVSKIFPPHKDIQDYLFDPRFLTDGVPPNDRGCRICKKIGHICKDCPQRKASGKKRGDKRSNGNERNRGSSDRDGDQRNVRANQQQQRGGDWGNRNKPVQSNVQQNMQQQQQQQQQQRPHSKQQPPSVQQVPQAHSSSQQQRTNNWWPEGSNPSPLQQRGNQAAPPPARAPNPTNISNICPDQSSSLKKPETGFSPPGGPSRMPFPPPSTSGEVASISRSIESSGAPVNTRKIMPPSNPMGFPSPPSVGGNGNNMISPTFFKSLAQKFLAESQLQQGNIPPLRPLPPPDSRMPLALTPPNLRSSPIPISRPEQLMQSPSPAFLRSMAHQFLNERVALPPGGNIPFPPPISPNGCSPVPISSPPGNSPKGGRPALMNYGPPFHFPAGQHPFTTHADATQMKNKPSPPPGFHHHFNPSTPPSSQFDPAQCLVANSNLHNPPPMRNAVVHPMFNAHSPVGQHAPNFMWGGPPRMASHDNTMHQQQPPFQQQGPPADSHSRPWPPTNFQ